MVKFVDETKAQFAERIMIEKGFTPRDRSMKVVKRMFRTPLQKADSESVMAEMMQKHDKRFEREWRYGGPEIWEKSE